ncbi:MAG TPA: VWA domain-containing protein, partial [Vicinamibacterales bacterium]|nr:VWA domain-containing protein [Vicinamibacterales bacterium]
MSPSIRRAWTVACASVAAWLGSAWLVAQQQPATPPPTFRSNVDVVRLDVSVLDKDRHPVRGLTAADFTIEEDGRERPIVAFAPVELSAAPAATTSMAAWTRDAPRDVVSNEDANTGRLVVIALDWSIRFYDQQLARRIASAAVDGLGPTDQAAVLFTTPNAAAGMPQGFTTDRARLQTAINRPFAVALTNPTPDGGKKIVDPEHYGDGACLCGLCTLESLTRLAGTLGAVSQRPKVVLFVGTYVRTYEVMTPTRIPQVVQGPNPQITPTFTSMPGATDCPGRLLDARRAFEHATRAANVVVHVLDPAGLVTNDDDPIGDVRKRLNTLPVMADITGGRTVLNTNAPEAQVPAILDESRAYYVIGFDPAPGKIDRERHIEVHVKPRGLSVRARDSYNLADESTSSSRVTPPLTRSVSDVVPRAEVPLEASAVPLIAG